MQINPRRAPRQTATPASELRRAPAAVHFRVEIEKAEAAGAAREDMTLRLTLNDSNQIRRDATLPLADLSFAGGVMRFLGVRVEEGGVPASVLVGPQAP